jgi:hypothetical protein
MVTSSVAKKTFIKHSVLATSCFGTAKALSECYVTFAPSRRAILDGYLTQKRGVMGAS